MAVMGLLLLALFRLACRETIKTDQPTDLQLVT